MSYELRKMYGLEVENKRLKTLLYNAIVLLEDYLDSDDIQKEINMTEEEYFRYMLEGDN